MASAKDPEMGLVLLSALGQKHTFTTINYGRIISFIGTTMTGVRDGVGKIEARMKQLGIELPKPRLPGANYVPFVLDGELMFITGQLSQWNGERRFVGKLGQVFDLDAGREADRLASLNVIAHLRSALDGNLDRITRCVRIAIYVNSDPEFHEQSQVANGASDLFMEIFGEAGRHTRMAIGVSALPYNVATEVEGVFSVRQ